MSIQLSTLPNGFRVVTYSIPHLETISMGVWIGAGSRYETLENNGIAHFLEHMAFKGTKTQSAFDIVQKIESVGGDLNAATSQDMTCYHASLLKKDTRLGIEILSDILQNSTFLKEEIERERRVVLQEIDQTEDTPEEIIFDHFQGAAFPDQPLGRPILGPRKNVKAFEKETLCNFIDQNYVPGNMVFSAAGNLDHEKIVEQIKDTFLYSKKGLEVKPQPAFYKGGYSHTFKKLEQQHLAIGFEGVALGSTEFYVAHCYSGLLGGGMSSRLFQEIREKRGLVYGISSFSSSHKDTGLFGIYTGTSEDKMEEIIKVILGEIEGSLSNLTSEEVERSKNQLKAHILMAQEKTSYWANSLAKQVLNFGKTTTTKEIIEKIEKVDKDSLKKFAKKLLVSEVSLAFIGPRKKDIQYRSLK